MKRILALLLMTTPLMADEASEIKAHWQAYPYRNHLNRYVKHITAIPRTGTVYTTNVTANANYTNQHALVELLTSPPISINPAAIPRPPAKGDGRTLRKVIDAKLAASRAAITDLDTAKDYMEMLEVSTRGLALWQELDADGAIYDDSFDVPTITNVTATAVYGQSIAASNGWTGFLAAPDKIEYLRNAIK